MKHLLDSLKADRGRLADVRADDHGVPVPSCPEWDLRALLVHLGRVHRWARLALDTPPDAEWPSFGAAPPADTNIVEWLLEGLDDLIECLGSSDLDTPAWTFRGPGTRRFWLRRQALETAVHRWDAQQAAGAGPDVIEGLVAADGIDEWCELEAARWFTPSPGLVAKVHLHATDGDGEWIIEVDESGLTWRRGHEKGDVAVRGPRSDLYLSLWNRLSLDSCEVIGDRRAAERFLEAGAVN